MALPRRSLRPAARWTFEVWRLILQGPTATKLSLFLAMIALGVAGCGGGDDNGDEAAPTETASRATTSLDPSQAITVDLQEVDDSKQSGTATLVPGTVGSIDIFKVELEIRPALDAPQMAHVHRATCAGFAKLKSDKQILTVHTPLADVREGKGEPTTVPGSIATGEFSINVHEPTSPFPAVACGDIPKRPE
jgi:hypothetical protein